jgi:ankyrin repeat protein
LHLVKRLLDVLDGGAVDAADETGSTAVHAAAFRGRAGVLYALLHGRADANHRDGRGTSALMTASLRGHTRAVEVLVQNGADKDAVDRNGYTAFMFAALAGQACGHHRGVDTMRRGCKGRVGQRREDASFCF